MNTFKAIAAMSLNRLIGKDDDVPWNIPEDLKWFKQQTLGHVVLLGRRSYATLDKPLPGRENVVMTRKNGISFPGALTIRSLDELPEYPGKIVWVAGGGDIYELALPLCEELYLTVVKQNYEDGDVYMPPFEHMFTLKETIVDKDQYSIHRYVNHTLVNGG